MTKADHLRIFVPLGVPQLRLVVRSMRHILH